MITPVELARKHLGQYEIKGTEIIPRLCPFCAGGDRGDKGTFAVNINNGAYNCKRGHCAEQGSFYDLCKHYGEQSAKFEFKRQEKTYRKPTTKSEPIGKATKYLEGRGISSATIKKWKVGEKEGKLLFPYFEGGELVAIKHREAKDGGKWTADPGGKPVLYGIDFCMPGKPLIITEGEIDALTLSDIGFDNVVSVPNGANALQFIDTCWEFLNLYDSVWVWVDNDEPGIKLQRELIKRLGEWRCSVVNGKYKDANETLLKEGRKAVFEAIEQAEEVPCSGLLRLADVERFDVRTAVKVPSSLGEINDVIRGYMMGQVSCWTGINSSGKSSFLGQELLTAIDNGFSVCAFSGELTASLFRYWIDLQAAGALNITTEKDDRENYTYHVNEQIENKIRSWYEDKFYLLDSFGGVTQEKLTEVFSYAAKRYGCKVFLVDNLMIMSTGEDREFYRNQSEFVGGMKDLAHRLEVHIHLVAHPRKTEGKVRKVDVMGSGDITNRVDNVFGVHRYNPENKEDMESISEGYGNSVSVFKNRVFGWQNHEVRLMFCEQSKRFYRGNKNFKFGWEVSK